MLSTKSKRRMFRRKGKKTLTKRRFRKARDVGDFASCSVRRTLAGPVGGNFVTGTMYEFTQCSLNTFLRASTIARGYQHYRIKKITLTLKPAYDTYQSAVGGSSRPQMYYIIDKSGSVPVGVTLEGLKQMGAKPRSFDDKPMSILWRPSVLQDTQNNALAGEASAYKISPWLSTVNNDINHYGIWWYAEQLFNPGSQYNAEVEVQFEFKKPLWGASTSATPAYSVKPALEDNSPDGIENGPDGMTVH